MKKRLFVIFTLLVTVKSFAQTVSPGVINSMGGGGTVGTTGYELYYNIGEPIVSTISNSSNVITQGFLQPDIVGVLDLSLSALFQNESCLNKKDGFITLILNTAPSSAVQIRYEWTPAGICPSHDCMSVDSLAPGSYTVQVKAYNSFNVAIDSVAFTYNVLASIEPCQITVFNGFTPNGDGINDSWVIENIENFPGNSVSIFNRWGSQIWSTTHYNNTDNKWDGKNNSGAEVPSGTYFYVIEIENGIKKGWVEVSGK